MVTRSGVSFECTSDVHVVRLEISVTACTSRALNAPVGQIDHGESLRCWVRTNADYADGFKSVRNSLPRSVATWAFRTLALPGQGLFPYRSLRLHVNINRKAGEV